MPSLDVDGYWVIKVVNAEGGGACGNFLTYDNSKVYHIDWLLLSQLISL